MGVRLRCHQQQRHNRISMKIPRILPIVLALIVGAALFCNEMPKAVAQTDASGATAVSSTTTTTLPPVAPEDLRHGLWRDGMAVFSDIQLLDFFIPAPFARGYKPDQPINFSHRLHVEKNGMECQYCHANVAKASFATIPSVELCMGCHTNVRTDRPDIKLLKKHWDEKKPVEWEPVNNLPEHAKFNHERHVKGGVGCQSCHGQVQKMDKVERVSSLKMGFCVSCHRDRGVTIDCAACHY